MKTDDQDRQIEKKPEMILVESKKVKKTHGHEKTLLIILNYILNRCC